MIMMMVKRTRKEEEKEEVVEEEEEYSPRYKLHRTLTCNYFLFLVIKFCVSSTSASTL
jgi:hypothetical protein